MRHGCRRFIGDSREHTASEYCFQTGSCSPELEQPAIMFILQFSHLIKFPLFVNKDLCPSGLFSVIVALCDRITQTHQYRPFLHRMSRTYQSFIHFPNRLVSFEVASTGAYPILSHTPRVPYSKSHESRHQTTFFAGKHLPKPIENQHPYDIM